MLDYNERGHEGEEQACLFLAARNYRILARNWRSHHHEIDIIADQYGELVFVEVKADAMKTIFQPLQLLTRKNGGMCARPRNII